MEYLMKCFQQRQKSPYDRLHSLTQTFLSLLNNLEDSKLFVSKPELWEIRLEYIGTIIGESLRSQQQRTIQKLNRKITVLQDQLKMMKYENVCKESPGKSFNSTVFSPEESDLSITNKSKRKPTSDVSSSLQSSDGSLENTLNSYNFKYLKLKI